MSSAGTDDYPHVVWPYTRGYLLQKGFDVSGHRRRTLTRAILDESHLVVAMSTDHQAFIRTASGCDVPLYLEVCGLGAEWLPDIEDVIPDYQTNRPAVEAHRARHHRPDRRTRAADGGEYRRADGQVRPTARVIAVRRALASDAPEIAACVDAAYRHYIPRVGRKPGPMLRDYAEAIRDEQVHVVEQDGSIVGALVLAVAEEGFLLEMIAVHPSAQRTGVGRRLLEFSETEARRQGYASIYLYTHEKMTENLALYSRIGYVEYGRRTEQGLARVYMRKELR